MKPSKKTIINFDRVNRKYLKGEIDDQTYWHYTNSLFTLYDSIFDFHAGQNELRRLRHRKWRWKKRIKEMVGDLYLVTLTLDDKHLNQRNVRKRVTYALNYFDDYYACADYGKKKGRLHYHAICSLMRMQTLSCVHNIRTYKRKLYCDLIGFDWTLGFYSIRPIISYSDKAFNYAFKSASYAFKRAEEGVDDTRPFGKTKLHRFMEIDDETIQFLDDMVLRRRQENGGSIRFPYERV